MEQTIRGLFVQVFIFVAFPAVGEEEHCLPSCLNGGTPSLVSQPGHNFSPQNALPQEFGKLECWHCLYSEVQVSHLRQILHLKR